MDMNSPKVSIIIPTYKGADVLLEAVQSILKQTYQNFEIIIVDDASPDHTANLFHPPPDPRIKYLMQEKNAGARAARRVGIRASSGDIIAFLDQDDLYHPEKLQAHVEYLNRYPNVGMTYNARFSISDSIEFIREIWHPPQHLTLQDVVRGFPLSPSDMILRRKWALPKYMEGPWGNSGGEIVLLGRLLLDGCKFGYIDRALNYRRYESGRNFGNIAGNCDSELKCLDIIFSDPRCPTAVLEARVIAPLITYFYWGSRAYAQGQVELGREYYLKSLQSNTGILEGTPSPMMSYLMNFVIEDESQDHVEILNKIFTNLPPELQIITREQNWAIACGYLMKGARSIMWKRFDQGREHIEQLKSLRLEFDDSHFERLSGFLVDYDAEFGYHATKRVLNDWHACFGNVVDADGMRRLEGKFLLGRAFRNYEGGHYLKVPGSILRALVQNPAHLQTPGVLSVLWRSFKGVAKWIVRKSPYRIIGMA